ncbi:MAG: threonine synthase [Steroidobacteraceae bacterium]
MRFVSTRDPQLGATLSETLLQGLAPDGGLYLPDAWPPCASLDEFPAAADLAGIGERLLAPFAAGDQLAPRLGEITREAFDFPAPLVELAPDGSAAVLELFHGPTAAFKDFGARFLAACLTRLRERAARPLEILVATSGDTGGAVAAAFHRRPGIGVVVLFPKGRVSPTQERQLTCWGDNVRSFAVRGTFDDCQRLAKEAFLDVGLRAAFDLSSANSISLGRLLPQMVYYAAASLATHRRHGIPASFIIPSGNLGNATACVMARRLGLPIAEIVLAHNANRTVPDFFDTGDWRPRASLATRASAMDVGNPSNMERLRSLLPSIERLRAELSAASVADPAIRARIREDFARYRRIWCPHTAVAAEVYARLPGERRTGRCWIVVATAHPAKFRETVEPLIGQPIPMPPALARLFDRPLTYAELDVDLQALRDALSRAHA